MFSKYFGITCLFFFLLISLTTYSQKRLFSARAIEKRMVRVSDSMYACKYETSNQEYNYFLKELYTTDSSLYYKCLVDSAGWERVLSYCAPMVLYYDRHPAYANFPVVNIRYEGAQAYCRWLTEKYNVSSRRKFKKVIFTLPSAQEWIIAARGGHYQGASSWRNYSLFPWGFYGMVNKKGFYLCNFKPVGDPYYVRDSLGNPTIVNYNGEVFLHTAMFPAGKIFHTMEVNSFYPNDLGIYNTCGNVAEMIIETDKAMGGSWKSYAGEVRVTSIKQYDYPSAEAGFRVFMKILEP